MGRKKTGHRIDKKILEYLREHKRATPGEMAEFFGVTNVYVLRRLKVLIQEGKVRKVYMGLYELAEPPDDKNERA